MTVKGAPGPWAVSAEEEELRHLTTRLQSSTTVCVGWQPRGGGIINASTVLVELPDEPGPRPTTNADLASLRALELGGAIMISWPWRTMQPNEDHAPLDEAIEQAARLL